MHRFRRTGAAVVVALSLAAAPALAQDDQGYFDRPVAPPYCEADDERVEVLLLGSYHMSNPGADAFNLEADDVLAPRRQGEIASVVDRLAGFEPTRVAVEAPWDDSATFARWREVASGEREPRRSEEEQIGFRLAMQSGLDSIHPVDYRMGLDFASLGRVAQQDPGLGARMASFQSMGQEAIALLSGWLADGSVGYMLRRMNEPEFLAKAHWPYVDLMTSMVAGEDYAGPEVVADWYERNLKIFANLMRITGSEDDRIFVIFGQGHVPILRQLVIDHPDYCVEDPLPYLEGL